ncbi:hypothetical protein HGRIS_012666 [Hohenbuehelia grisea]|uniref:Uncharacterized protein n=1 Tax=Hohenbuehelia grisea TaxID=104357 RepID=A0ABR3IT37_9AGAR
MKLEQGDLGNSAGYKAPGACAVDETGRKDTSECINISLDDALTYPAVAKRTYSHTVMDRMASTVQPSMAKSGEVNLTLIDFFNDRLGLPKGTLRALHTGATSGSEARCNSAPARPANWDPRNLVIGAHTDFGSLSFLHNRLGGLQASVPGSEDWQYRSEDFCCSVLHGEALIVTLSRSLFLAMQSAT